LDEITQAVKAFYQAYPYPSRMPEQGQAADPRGILAAALRNPEIRFTGIAINPAGLVQAGK
jgi:hypothetical protein